MAGGSAGRTRELLPQDGELYVLVQSTGRVLKERAIRRRKLTWLWKWLKELLAMQLTREELPMKLGGARSAAKAAPRLVIIEVTVTPLSDRMVASWCSSAIPSERETSGCCCEN